MSAQPAKPTAYFSPTPRAVVLMGMGVPLTLALGLFLPDLWPVGAAWIALIAGACVVDLVMGPQPSSLQVDQNLPQSLHVGEAGHMDVQFRFAGTWPQQLEIRPVGSAHLRIEPDNAHISMLGPEQKIRWSLLPERRGEANLSGFWLRWCGPLGLIFRVRNLGPSQTIPVITNMNAIRTAAIRLFSREQIHGLKWQKDKGEGTEFDSLREFVAGMDHRKIDWKASARHNNLLAKEFRTERNHNIMIALDTGHAMQAPLGNQPRLDHALQAGLLLAFTGLRTGDRVGFYAFDSEPVLHVKPLQHAGSFAVLQRMTSGLQYSTRETNYTLGLTRLQQTLDRRTLVVVFTDFTDTISAELMLENVARLQRDHVVLFVVLADMELQEMTRVVPQSADDVSQAVIAAGLLKERELVLHRLIRMGVRVLETEPDKLGADLISHYLAIKAEGGL